VADIGLIRKRIRAEMDRARHASADRRARAAEAARAYETWLADLATPVFRQMAQVLRAEHVPFEVQTPAGAVRLVSERNREDSVGLELDTSLDPPAPVLVTTRSRGSRLLRTEHPVKDGAPIGAISEDDLIEQLIGELRPWLE
jgi:hypothetical protein